MSIILIFLLVLAGLGGWWLVRQGLMSKPWLETGAGVLPADPPLPIAKFGLSVFLTVIGCLFALLASAYFMRMEYADWRNMPVPNMLWISNGMLVLSCVLLQCAVAAARDGDLAGIRTGLTIGGVAAVGFLIGQLLTWRELSASGFLMTENPANSFFYLITGMHGLHMLGGLVALALPLAAAWRGEMTGRLRLRIELCATYWHFLLFVWLGLVILFMGWAREFIDICGQLLS
jgi:cytochrome c oxidase subunit 3